MSRHTTGHTTNPVYRARNEIRDRLQRLAEEARTTASSFGTFEMPDTEMWRLVDQMASGMADALEMSNYVDRELVDQRRQDTRRAGHELPDLEVTS